MRLKQAWFNKKTFLLRPNDKPTISFQRKNGGYTQYWYNGIHIHRQGGPAFISGSDTYMNCIRYYRKGVLHRQGGPAVIWDDGTGREQWWCNGMRHRENGPAISNRQVGYFKWYKHDKLIDEIYTNE